MATCRICSSDPKKRKAVDTALLNGQQQAAVAARSGFSRWQVRRHRRHLSEALAAGAKDTGELNYGRSLIEQIEAICWQTAKLEATAAVRLPLSAKRSAPLN
jgi:hypothetical protein